MGHETPAATEAGGASGPDGGGTVALLPWGDLIEDFLAPIGLTHETFATEMTGGWLFGYVDALAAAGVRAVIVCVSGAVDQPVRTEHAATGAPIWFVPPSRLYRRLRRRVRVPYGASVAEAFGPLRGPSRVSAAALRPVIPYLATPPRALARVLREEGCTAVLCQEYEYPRFDVCVLLGRLLRLPVFASFQGGTVHLSRLEDVLRPPALRASAGIIVASAHEVERVRRRYRLAPGKIAWIPNPFDVSPWDRADRAPVRAELGLEEDAAVVAWHGRVDIRNKGLDVLLEAWQALRPRWRGPLRLLLVGTGRDAAELRRLLDDAGDGVVWVDRYLLDRRLMARYLSAADVYAFPSRHEGSPVAPLEAMACGLPVVAAAAQGVREILEGEERCGLVVPVGDAGAFADALHELLDDEQLRQELGRRGRLRAETAFSLEAVGARLADVLLAGQPRHTRRRTARASRRRPA